MANRDVRTYIVRTCGSAAQQLDLESSRVYYLPVDCDDDGRFDESFIRRKFLSVLS